MLRLALATSAAATMPKGSSSAPVYNKYSLHYRSTSAGTGTGSPYAETNPSTYVLLTDNPYPIVRNSLTFGFASSSNLFVSDYGSATDPRISGRIQVGGTNLFKVDLPDGPGTYNVWLALGALTAANATAIKLVQSDGATAVTGGTLASTTPAVGHVTGADGVTDYTVAAWLAGNTPISVTFTGSSFGFLRNSTTAVYLACLEFQRTA